MQDVYTRPGPCSCCSPYLNALEDMPECYHSLQVPGRISTPLHTPMTVCGCLYQAPHCILHCIALHSLSPQLVSTQCLRADALLVGVGGQGCIALVREGSHLHQDLTAQGVLTRGGHLVLLEEERGKEEAGIGRAGGVHRPEGELGQEKGEGCGQGAATGPALWSTCVHTLALLPSNSTITCGHPPFSFQSAGTFPTKSSPSPPQRCSHGQGPYRAVSTLATFPQVAPPATGHFREGNCSQFTHWPGKMTGPNVKPQRPGRKLKLSRHSAHRPPPGGGDSPRLGPPCWHPSPPHIAAPHPVLQGLQVELVPDAGQGVDSLAQHCGEERRNGG